MINTEKNIDLNQSQNHGMFGVGRDLCGSSSPTPLPKQGHPEEAAQDLVQAVLEYLQRRRLHSLPGQPVPSFIFCMRMFLYFCIYIYTLLYNFQSNEKKDYLKYLKYLNAT